MKLIFESDSTDYVNNLKAIPNIRVLMITQFQKMRIYHTK